MGLSMRERRVLSRIEDELTREEPILAARLARLESTDPRPRTGHATSAESTMVRRVLLGALAALVGLSLLLAGRLSPPGVDDPAQRPARPATSCPGSNDRYADEGCVERPAHGPPGRVYPYGSLGAGYPAHAVTAYSPGVGR